MADGYVDSVSTLTFGPAEYSLGNLSVEETLDFHSPSKQPAPINGIDYCTNSSTSTVKLHIVMVPYPVQGQINPMMQFAKLLTARHDDIMVTFVNNKRNHDRIQRTRRSNANRNLHLTWVDSGRLPANFDYNDITTSDFQQLRESTLLMKGPLKQLLQSLMKGESSTLVSCVLLGTFCSWAQSAAAELGIPNFLFWTQSATVFSIYCHLSLLVSNNFFPYGKKSHNQGTTEFSDMVTYIPGLPPLHPSSFPSLLHVDDISDPSLATVREQFSLVAGSCNGIIINSFQELERDTWQALEQELPCPVTLVGPLLPSAFTDGDDLADNSPGASLLEEKSDCVKWLDGKQKQSVVYISFGSLFKPSTAEMEGIALGIKASKQPYLWVIRPCTSFQDVKDILPAGFVEETKEYGLIIPWAPQVQVLSHPAVGAFLTHCGWNSTLESLSMGMPMIAYPILLDQLTNGACVCEVWKVGMALKRHDNGKVKSEDVEKVLRAVMQKNEGSKMRERAMCLRDAAKKAAQLQGSSRAHIDKFIQVILKK